MLFVLEYPHIRVSSYDLKSGYGNIWIRICSLGFKNISLNILFGIRCRLLSTFTAKNVYIMLTFINQKARRKVKRGTSFSLSP